VWSWNRDTGISRGGQDSRGIEKLAQCSMSENVVSELDGTVVSHEFGEADLLIHDEESLNS